MRELTYSQPLQRPARKPKGPTAKRIAKRRRAEGPVKARVRAECVERDGYCRYGLDTVADRGFGCLIWDVGCSGPSEWAHLENHRRGRTRNMAPELRHTTAGTAMLCRAHHRAYDAGTLRIVQFTGAGADGPLTWRAD